MPKYFEFEVTLRCIEPRIWRRFLVRQTLRFYDLHEAIQFACGWKNYHLFAFGTERDEPNAPISKVIAGIPSTYDLEIWGTPVPDAEKVKLSSYFGVRKDRYNSCVYEYDFGDFWIHDIKLRRIVELPERFDVRLLDGARAFPPEDCGGISGYERCVEVFSGGEDEDNLREWMGDWDPECFDLEATSKLVDH